MAEEKRRLQRLPIDVVIVPRQGRRDRLFQIVVTESLEAQCAAARANGDRDLTLGGGNQEEHRALRRLFQSFQESVGGILIEIVGAIDDDHAPTPLAGAVAEKGTQAPDLVDADPLRIAFGALVPRAAQQEQVGMGLRRYSPEHRMLGADCRDATSGLLVAEGEHLTGKMIGERRLADAFGTDDQPGMVQPAALEGLLEFGTRRVVAEQAVDLAWGREAVKPVGLVAGNTRLFGRSPRHGRKRAATASHTSSATRASGLVASITTQRFGSSSAMSRKALRMRSC